MKGHVVATYQTKWGTCEICDDAYINKTPEEIEEVKSEISAVVNRILRRIAAEGGEAYQRLLDQANNG